MISCSVSRFPLATDKSYNNVTITTKKNHQQPKHLIAHKLKKNSNIWNIYY